MSARSGTTKPSVLAPTPPMGWNSWDCYGSGLTEDEFKANVDYMSEHLLRFGWQYAVIDIQWYQPHPLPISYPETDDLVMDEFGRLAPAPNRFPSAAGGRGFAPLAEYAHRKGLKFGIHIMRGVPRLAVKRNTPIAGTSYRAADIADKEDACFWCQNNWGIVMSRPGAQAYYDSIVKLYAEWGVDYIKADDMSRPYHAAEVAALSQAIAGCGRPIVLSLSPGPAPLDQAEHLKRHAQLWRVSDDLWDQWSRGGPGFEWVAGLKDQFASCADWAPHAGPGHWADPDMIPLGRISLRNQYGPERQSRLSPDEQRTLMTLWCIARSPLMFGGALPALDPFTLSLITNQEVLAVNQTGTNARQSWRRGDQIVWTADAPDGEGKYVALFNLTDEGAAVVEVLLDDLGLKGACAVRNLWEGRDVGDVHGSLSQTVPAHGAALYRLTPTRKRR